MKSSFHEVSVGTSFHFLIPSPATSKAQGLPSAATQSTGTSLKSIHLGASYPLVMTNSLLLKMAIGIVNLAIKNDDFP